MQKHSNWLITILVVAGLVARLVVQIRAENQRPPCRDVTPKPPLLTHDKD